MSTKKEKCCDGCSRTRVGGYSRLSLGTGVIFAQASAKED